MHFFVQFTAQNLQICYKFHPRAQDAHTAKNVLPGTRGPPDFAHRAHPIATAVCIGDRWWCVCVPYIAAAEPLFRRHRTVRGESSTGGQRTERTRQTTVDESRQQRPGWYTDLLTYLLTSYER